MCVAFGVWTALALACADAKSSERQDAEMNFFTGK